MPVHHQTWCLHSGYIAGNPSTGLPTQTWPGIRHGRVGGKGLEYVNDSRPLQHTCHCMQWFISCNHRFADSYFYTLDYSHGYLTVVCPSNPYSYLWGCVFSQMMTDCGIILTFCHHSVIPGSPAIGLFETSLGGQADWHKINSNDSRSNIPNSNIVKA